MSNVPVIVTEADREAAASLLRGDANVTCDIFRAAAVQRIRERDSDDHKYVQAFARHRIAATSTLQDQVEAYREAAIRAALCLSNFIGEGMFFERENGDPEDAWTALVSALGMPDADDDDLRAALTEKDISR